jgi:hypothetical protein
MPLVNEPLTDAVMVNYNGAFYIFSTKVPEQNSNKLYVYKSDSLCGNYALVGCYTFPDCSARGAGDIIKNGGRLFRPALDCNTEYGKGLVLQEVKYENGIFLFEELGRVYPSSKKWNAGLHTLNIYEHIAVIDGKRYKNALMRKMFLCANRLRKTVLKKIYGG